VIELKKSKEVISARLPKKRIRVIEEIAREEKVDKSTILDRALERYTKEWALQKAVELYRDGTVTLSRAAEIAGISIWEMIDVLGKRKIILQYDVEDLEEDLKTLGCG
jgi:predicted HTH domain antitoxin